MCSGRQGSQRWREARTGKPESGHLGGCMEGASPRKGCRHLGAGRLGVQWDLFGDGLGVEAWQEV